MNPIERVRATQKTVDAFKGRTFKEGVYDCVQLIVLHARNMGKQLRLPRYGDWDSAAAAMHTLGFQTLGQAMDHYFTRILPVEAMASDIVEMLGSNGFSSLSVSVGNGRVIGFHESVDHADILQPLIITGAWRIG